MIKISSDSNRTICETETSNYTAHRETRIGKQKEISCMLRCVVLGVLYLVEEIKKKYVLICRKEEQRVKVIINEAELTDR